MLSRCRNNWDITYIWTCDGFAYLTSIMDLFSRKIIAWTLSDNMEVSCVLDTVNKAKARRNTVTYFGGPSILG